MLTTRPNPADSQSFVVGIKTDFRAVTGKQVQLPAKAN